MEDIDHSEPIKDLIKAAEDLATAMEKSDLHLRSRKIIESANNWMIAVSAGTLLWILTNFDKFQILHGEEKTIFMKEPFIFISSIILTSLIFLGINKYILVQRDYIMCSAVDSLTSLVDAILKEWYLKQEPSTS